jgi:hypothetical protein
MIEGTRQHESRTMAKDALDRIGIVISSLCVLHCLAALLPLAAQSLAMPEWLHLALLSVALPVATVALWQGWRRHGRAAILLLGASGLTLLGTGLAFHEGLIPVANPAAWDRTMTSIGAVMLASAHWRNWRLMVTQ